MPIPQADFANSVPENQELLREDIIASSALSNFQKILLLTDGSISELLAIFMRGEIRSEKIYQCVTVETPPEIFAADGIVSVLHRRCMLTCESCPMIFAESRYISARLPQAFWDALCDTQLPIGVVWQREKAELHRQIIELRVESDQAVSAYFGLQPGTSLFSRTYLVWREGKVMGVITEKFPHDSFRDGAVRANAPD